MADLLSITPAAKRRIDHLMSIAEDPDNTIGIRIGVKNAGCSGMTYTMDFASEAGPHDEVIEVGDGGAKVVVDAMAVMFLVGTELDFKEEQLSATFVFNNPNATSTCGCGESFAVG